MVKEKSTLWSAEMPYLLLKFPEKPWISSIACWSEKDTYELGKDHG